MKPHAALKAILSPAANVGHPPGYIDLTAAHFERLHHQVLQTLVQGPERRLGDPDPGAQRVPRSAAARQGGRGAFQAQGATPKPLLNVITFGDFADNCAAAWRAPACRPSITRTRSRGSRPISRITALFARRPRKLTERLKLAATRRAGGATDRRHRQSRGASACSNRKPMRCASSTASRCRRSKWSIRSRAPWRPPKRSATRS